MAAGRLTAAALAVIEREIRRHGQTILTQSRSYHDQVIAVWQPGSSLARQDQGFLSKDR
jgi:hypothetical protein